MIDNFSERLRKFRAWDVDEKCMMSWKHLRAQNLYYNQEFRDVQNTLDKYGHTGINDIWIDDDFILMDWLGVEDTDDVEIYEGDFILHGSDTYRGRFPELGMVSYDQRNCCYTVGGRHRITQNIIDKAKKKTGGVKPWFVVVGNIFENPELDKLVDKFGDDLYNSVKAIKQDI